MKKILLTLITLLTLTTMFGQYLLPPQNASYDYGGKTFLTYVNHDTLFVGKTHDVISNIQLVEGYDILTDGSKFYSIDTSLEIHCGQERGLRLGKASSEMSFTSVNGQKIHITQDYINSLIEPTPIVFSMGTISIIKVIDSNFEVSSLVPEFIQKQ